MVEEEIKILIAEPQWIVREGIKSLLTKQKLPCKIEEADNTTVLEEKLGKFKPHVVLIDFDDQTFFSISTLDFINRKEFGCNTVIFSNNLQQSFILKAVENGAKGFISKRCNHHDIVNAIIAAKNGQKFFCGQVLDIMLHKNFWNNGAEKEDELSEREMEVLGWICKGFTNKEVAEKLFLSVHTINTHRKNIMRKMEVKSSAELIACAIKKRLVAN